MKHSEFDFDRERGMRHSQEEGFGEIYSNLNFIDFEFEIDFKYPAWVYIRLRIYKSITFIIFWL